MELSNSALRAQLGNDLEGLQSSLGSLSAHIQLRGHAAWVWRPPTVDSVDPLASPLPDWPRDRALEAIGHAIGQIKYEDGQDAHASIIAPGVVAVSGEGIALAEEVNRRKRRLAQTLLAMQDRKEWDIDPATQERVQRPLREVALEAFYSRRLHHFQATRELVILRETAQYQVPDYIGFTWASLRDIRRTSREVLLEELQRPHPEGVDIPGAAQDVVSLSKLPPGEVLAIVRPAHRTPRVNLSAPSKSGGAPRRTSKVAVLPLVLEGTALPVRLRKLPPAPLPQHYRLARSDVEIEAQPILISVPAHRYLPAVRDQKRREWDERLEN